MNYPDAEKLDQGVLVEGITSDYVWYNADLLTRKMGSWGHEFQKLINVMETRHKEHLQMIADLLQERGNLRREISNLKSKE
jgi:hypothetical protein